MKLVPRTVFVFYLIVLIWLILFKFSLDIPEVLDYQSRSLNIIPFAGAQDHLREMIDNFVVFIPFGLLLSVNFKRVNMWRKLACVFIFSVVAEAIQLVFAIGVTDITDIITNTLGGLFGLMLYALGNKYIDQEKQDRVIVVVGVMLLIVLLLFRFLVLKVRY